MMMGMIIALALVGSVMLAIYWGKKAGMDAARASDLVSIRDKNAKINNQFSKIRNKQNEELDAIDSAQGVIFVPVNFQHGKNWCLSNDDYITETKHNVSLNHVIDKYECQINILNGEKCDE